MGRFEVLGEALDLLFGKILNRNFSKADELIQKAEQKVDALKQEVDTIVASSGDGTKDTELILARGNAPTLGRRLDATDEQLADKAPQSEIRKLENQKADYIYVDQKIQELGNLKINGTFGTLADLTAAYPNGSEGIYVVQDKGEWYIWGGTTWESGGKFQSDGIADKSVGFEKQSFLTYVAEGNLFNGSYVKDKWVVSTNGVYTDIAGTRLALIKIEKDGIYSIKTNGVHDRFIVSLLNYGVIGEVALLKYVKSTTTGNESFVFIHNTDHNYLSVGISSSGEEPSLTVKKLDNQLLSESLVSEDTSNSYAKLWMNYTNGEIATVTQERSSKVSVLKGRRINIKTKGAHDRFTVGGYDGISNTATVIYRGKNGDGTSGGSEDFSFYNINYEYIIIGISSDGVAKPQIEVTMSETNAVALMRQKQSVVDDKLLKDKSVGFEKQNFISSNNRSLSVNVKNRREVSHLKRSIWVNFLNGDISDENTQRSVVCEVPHDTNILIKTVGSHDRFVVSLANTLSGKAKVVYTGVNNNGVSVGNESYSLLNTENYRYLIIGLTTASQSPIVILEYANQNNYAIDNLSCNPIRNSDEIYPVLCAVKMTNKNDYSKGHADVPRPIGWLYYSPKPPYALYYASGRPDNMKFVCYWDESITWNSRSSPEWYRPFITKDGDIIFVFRGDLLGAAPTSSLARQNPIVYPAGNWDNPVVVNLGGLKPTAWLQNCGADYLYNDDVFMFSEYTRPFHLTTNVWRVTKPFTNPANWITTSTHVLSGDNHVGMKHCHTLQYDTFSGKVYYTTGDDDSASAIYDSSNKGLTWNLSYSGSRKYARVLNFVFTKEGAFWANDDALHSFNFAPRINGTVDFSRITELFDLTGHPPTYVNSLVDDPYGILLLHRHDGISSDSTLSVHFWDIANQEMHVLDVLQPVNDQDLYGFRVEAANFYQSRGNNATVVGFANPYNNLRVLNNYGNNNETRINNLILRVIKENGGYKLTYEAFQLNT